MKEKRRSGTFFGRLIKIAMKNYCLLIIGILSSLVQGAILPLYGVFLAKMLFVLNHPEEILIPSVDPDEPPIFLHYDKHENSDFWCIMMFLCAIAVLFASFLKRYTFGYVGEQVTYQLRLSLFQKILSMPKKWFDDERYQPANLISIISYDA